MRRAIINIALTLASIIFTLFVAEGGLRLYGYLYGYREDNRYPVEFDAELGWAPKPNVQPHYNSWGTTMTTLEDGTRSNRSRAIQNGTEPILAVGDSFTWGDHVSDWETWPAQLEQLSGRKVVNGGVPGYGVDQTFLRAKRLLGRNHFSIVIFSFIPGDIERGQYSVMFTKVRPYFDFEGRQTHTGKCPDFCVVASLQRKWPALYSWGQSACPSIYEESISKEVGEQPS